MLFYAASATIYTFPPVKLEVLVLIYLLVYTGYRSQFVYAFHHMARFPVNFCLNPDVLCQIKCRERGSSLEGTWPRCEVYLTATAGEEDIPAFHVSEIAGFTWKEMEGGWWSRKENRWYERATNKARWNQVKGKVLIEQQRDGEAY